MHDEAKKKKKKKKKINLDWKRLRFIKNLRSGYSQRGKLTFDLREFGKTMAPVEREREIEIIYEEEVSGNNASGKLIDKVYGVSLIKSKSLRVHEKYYRCYFNAIALRF